MGSSEPNTFLLLTSRAGRVVAGIGDPGYSLCAGFLCGAEPKTLLYLPLVSK